jgi:hypothetical protein
MVAHGDGNIRRRPACAELRTHSLISNGEGHAVTDIPEESMSTTGCRTIAVGALLLLSLSTAGSAREHQFNEVIDGSKTPERIPMSAKWESFFLVIVDVAFNTDGSLNEDNLAGLAKYNIGIPLEEARVVAWSSSRALTAMRRTRKPLSDEHETGRLAALSSQERVTLVERGNAALVQAAESMLKALPEPSAQAVERYLRRVIVPGMKYSFK